MKYLVVLGDGMADYPMEELDGKTALQYARTPNFDLLAQQGDLGMVQTIPGSLPPGSDTANMSVLGYNPLEHYTGRSPFEAASLGVDLGPEDISFRCNLVTLSADEPYGRKTMVDYCAGEISTGEAGELIGAVQKEFGSTEINFHSGFRYRHLMVWNNGPADWQLTPPHDISGKNISEHLPAGKEAGRLLQMMERSYSILSEHPVNRERISKGLNPANSIWIWGEGSKPLLKPFSEKYGLQGSVISAVDLIKGIGIIAGLKVIRVEGATGDIDTNFSGKVDAALNALKQGQDFVYLHIEAPDECSHRFETGNKIRAIELIDQKVVKVVRDQLERSGFDFSIMLVTDHATPLSLGTHTREPVPFAIFRSQDAKNSSDRSFDEVSASKTGILIGEGYRLMDRFLNRGQSDNRSGEEPDEF
jgi:2,3-bisphosphoglycerate-independent phosphoglycerate mutase